MNMKTNVLIILLSVISANIQAQDYVDILKIAGKNIVKGNKAGSYLTEVTNFKTELYYPTQLNEDLVILSGFTIENTNLELMKEGDRGSLLMTRLNLGFKYQHSDKWAGIYVSLPKLASDFEDIGKKDFQFGGLALLNYQISEPWKIKFGVYSSSENYGTTLTPIIGVWHRSKDRKFYINATLPIKMDLNYALTNKGLSLGFDLLSSIKSYNLSEGEGGFYVQEESIRFGFYLAHSFLDNALILKARGGLDQTDYGVYSSGDTIGVQVLKFPLGGDNRYRLNPEFTTSVYLGIDLVYRFDLTKVSK